MVLLKNLTHQSENKEKKNKGLFKKSKIDDIIEDDENQTFNNQILNWKK